MHQQHHTAKEENNLLHDLQTQVKTSIPPALTATHYCNFCQDEEHSSSTCEAKRKADADLTYRIVPATNMGMIYIDFKDSYKEDSDFYLPAHVGKDNRIRDAYITGIRKCTMWYHLYNAPQAKKGVSRDNGFCTSKI